MKLIKDEFEKNAQEQDDESAEELSDYSGGNVNAYRRYKKQVPISKETFTQICWEVGMSDAADFIKFESDEQERYREITEEF